MTNYIYGAGTVGRALRRVMSANNVPFGGFIDQFDRTVPGETVYKLAQIDPEDSTVVMSVMNAEADIEAIERSLQGFKYIVHVHDFYDHFGLSGSWMWLTSVGNYLRWADRIDQATNIWNDKASFDLFTEIILYRTGQSAPPERGPVDLPMFKEPMRLIECGAYDGQSIVNLAKDFDIEACLAFEPDIEHYQKLKQLASSKIATYCMGVYSDNVDMPFAARGDLSSEIARDGNTTIHCAALDKMLPYFAPTFIRMDIEGAEMNALLGAEQMIHKYHPTLAISVYHKPGDLWDIPLWVNEIGGYDLRLGVHARCTFDTVLYAVPK